MNRIHSGDGERGATLVEFAFVAPLLFLMLGSMLDIGLAVLGRSVASNAAREGARVGIIQFVDADIPGSEANDAIIFAVDQKLVGLVRPDPNASSYVDVKCLDGDDPDTSIPCTRAIQVDHDLIEVTVKWRSIAPAGGIFTPDAYDDYARMVIIGDGGGGGGGCAGDSPNVYFDPTDVDVHVDEGDSPDIIPVALTLTRANGKCETTVGYGTADLDATGGDGTSAGDDYVETNSQITFFAGETSKPITINIIGDDIPEADERFTVTINSAVNGTIVAPVFATITIDDDETVAPPTPESRVMKDTDPAPAGPDGKIDQVVIRFDKEIAQSCANPTAFSFPHNPNGVSLQSLAFTGTGDDEVTLYLNEGGVDTSSTALTVALAPGCIQGKFGGADATFGELPITDGAGPVLVSVLDSDTSGTDNGTFQRDDWVEFTFSEPLRPTSLGVATSNVTLVGGNGSNNDSVRIPGLLVGDISLGSSAYTTQSNGAANFLNSTVALSNGNRTIRVTLVSACSGSGQNCNRVAQGGQASVSFVFDPNLRSDSVDNLPIWAGPISVRLF